MLIQADHTNSKILKELKITSKNFQDYNYNLNIYKSLRPIIKELESLDKQENFVSVYLDLDPSHFILPKARNSLYNWVLEEVKSKLKEANLEEKVSILLKLEQQKDWFIGLQGARSVSLFISKEHFYVLLLNEKIETKIYINNNPYLKPLYELPILEQFALVILGAKHTKIYYSDLEHLSLVETIDNIMHFTHDKQKNSYKVGSKSGNSEYNYQRSIEEENDKYFNRIADHLFKLFKSNKYKKLIIAGNHKYHKMLEEKLHSYINIVGNLDLDTNLSDHEIHKKVKNLIELSNKEYEEKLFNSLLDNLASKNSTAIIGANMVLESLYNSQVDLLFINKDTNIKGGICPKCQRIIIRESNCPIDNSLLESEEYILQNIAYIANSKNSKLIYLDNNELKDLGGFAAVLRY